MATRPPAVAGTFYPNDPEFLRETIDSLLRGATAAPAEGRLRALIVPHAGYVYSGPVAASAYRLLRDNARSIRRVLLLGPSHRVALRGIAVPEWDAFNTPLGTIALDRDAMAGLSDLPLIEYRDDAHALEHSLEVQLPFLQAVLGDFTLLPLVVGQVDSDSVARVIERFWDDEETLIVVSSDLSHFHSYATARRIDADTSRRIENLDSSIVGEEACGCHPLNGLLRLAAARGCRVTTLDQRNSGDTAGSRDQVVGYGSYVVSD